MRKALCLAAVLVSFSLCLSFACASTEDTPETEGKLTILSHELTTYMYEIPAVEGQAKNTGGDKLGQIMIRVEFKDSSGLIVKTAEGTKESLFPGEVWDFRVLCEGEDPSSVVDYEIVAP